MTNDERIAEAVLPSDDHEDSFWIRELCEESASRGRKAGLHQGRVETLQRFMEWLIHEGYDIAATVLKRELLEEEAELEAVSGEQTVR